jgi:hypothetical protein
MNPSRSSLLLDLFLERTESRRPEVLDEGRHWREALGPDRVEAPGSFSACLDEPSFPEDGEVLGRRLLRDVHRIGDLADGAWTCPEQTENLDAPRFSERLER